MKTAILVLLAAVPLAADEPAPRKPAGQVVKVNSPLAYVSGVAELPDGRLIVSDHKTPRLLMLVLATGEVRPVGSPGSASGQYVRPGGFYGMSGKGLWLLDRGLTRVSAVSPTGELSGSTSILPRGSSGSSSSDFDIQRLDGRGHAYYFNRDSGLRGALAGTTAPMLDLIRFDPSTQASATIASLQQRLTQTMSGGDGMIFSRQVIGSPADGWGVAADGRVAVVRATPYRVDWYSGGKETKGPVYAVDVLAMTEADKNAYIAAYGKAGGGTASVGMAGAGNTVSQPGANLQFADTKPPFDPDYIVVSPLGRVFVPRSVPFGSADVVYDVFDGRGQRVDRIALPATSRIVGFGATAIYVREGSDPNSVLLKKYEVR